MSILNSIPVVIFCGGKNFITTDGTCRAKGLLTIDSKNGTMLKDVINHYRSFGAKIFYIATGIDHKNIEIEVKKWKFDDSTSVQCIYSGDDSTTLRRLSFLKELLQSNKTFALTYSDTVSNVDLESIFNLHQRSNTTVSVCAAQLPTRFRIFGFQVGDPIIKGVAQKPVVQNNWINGGYYFIENKIFNHPLFNNEKATLEKELLEDLIKNRDVTAYKHSGFWHHVDSERDIEKIQEHYLSTRV